MNTNTLHTAPALSASPARRRAAWQATLAGVALVAGLGAAGVAQARSDVSWSVGIGAPGVSVGVTNGYGYVAPPVVYAPAPVYVPPPRVVYNPPVYYAPRPVYYAPPVVYAPQRPYYGPGPYYRDYDRGHRHGNGHGHGKGHRYDR